MDDAPTPTFRTRVTRALRRRCPRCGAPAFDSYFSMRETCVGCGLRFEREAGYWVGALIVNTAVIFGTFLASFGLGLALTWPAVPWTALLITLLVVNGLVPILFYPQSKAIWSAMELGWNPLEPDEIEAASERLRTR